MSIGTDAANREHMAREEVNRLAEELKPQLLLTNSKLDFDRASVMYSFSTLRVVFRLFVATTDPKDQWRQAVSSVNWSSMTIHHHDILTAIQENIKRLGQHDHNATNTAG